MTTSDGSTASYYQLPTGATELQDLISYRNMNAQDGEIFRAIYRKGKASHSDELRDARKVLFYAQAEVKRLEQVAASKNAYDSMERIDRRDYVGIAEKFPPGALTESDDRLLFNGKYADDINAALDGLCGSTGPVTANTPPVVDRSVLKKILEELDNAYIAAGDYKAFKENCELVAQAMQGNLPTGWQ